jgi:hypothetical protein
VFLYSAAGGLFIENVLLNPIAEKLRISFADSPSELYSWRDSLQSEKGDAATGMRWDLPVTPFRVFGNIA